MLYRTIGSHRGWHGSDQYGYAGSREKLDWNGKMLWLMCFALSKVSRAIFSDF